MIKIVKMLPALALVFGFSSQASADVDWSLTVKFSDGAIARGTFITNDAGTALESWKVHVRKGLEAHDFVSKSTDGVSTPDDFGELTLTPISWPTGTVEALEFGDFGSGAYSIFYLGNLLTGEARTGDEVQGDNSQGDNGQGDNSGEDGHPVKIIGAIDCGKGDCGALQTGSIIDPPLPDPPLDPAPEPISIILLGSVVVFISGGAMRRRAKNRDA
jgi:hypothetical protein